MAIMLCALIVNVKAINTGNEPKNSKTTECVCCKNCKDEKCKELCKQYSDLTAEAQQSEEGKKIKAECMALCEKNKCCSSSDKATCEGKEAKGCCKKK